MADEAPKKRGRPPGTGWRQKAEAQAAADRVRQLALTPVEAGTPGEPANPRDPLDFRLPRPEFEARGPMPQLDDMPGTMPQPGERSGETGRGNTPVGPLFVNPDEDRPLPGQDAASIQRGKMLEALAREDSALEPIALGLKLKGYSTKDIAELLAVRPEKVRRVLKQARSAGRLSEALTDLTTEALPLAVEGLVEKLAAGEWDAIKETLKGLGAFRHYTQQTNRDEGGDPRKLEVTFVMPEGGVQPMNPKGIVGMPRGAIEGEVTPVPDSPAQLSAPVTESAPNLAQTSRVDELMAALDALRSGA